MAARKKPWTEEELTRAVTLRRARVSSANIGRALNRSRNSVIGALYRHGEPGVLNGDPWHSRLPCEVERACP